MLETRDAAIGILIPFLGTALGACFVFFLRGEVRPWVQKLLLGFASGVMIAASVWSLIIPAIEMAEGQGTTPWLPAALGFLAGVGFLLLLIRRCFRAEDLLLLVCAGLLYNVMRGKLSLEGLMAGEAAVQPAEFWTVLLARSGLGLGSVSFPVSALVFCFAALLGARFAAAHKRLRDENDMFI